MPRVSKQRILDRKREYLFLDDFWSATTSLGNKEEIRGFFQELLTKEEQLMLAKRFQIILMLLAGYSEGEIDDYVKVTRETIQRIQLKAQASKGYLKGVAERILRLKKKIAEREQKGGYRIAEAELLKSAAKIAVGALVRKMKEASVTR